MQNSADELKPCAIIIISLALSPRFDPVKEPAHISPIWPMDE